MPITMIQIELLKATGGEFCKHEKECNVTKSKIFPALAHVISFVRLIESYWNGHIFNKFYELELE